MTEQMTLEKMREQMARIMGPGDHLISAWIDAIDAHLNAAKGEAVAWQYREVTEDGPSPVWDEASRMHFEILRNDRRYEVRELYTHPASPDVVRDAERYRWLRDKSVHFELPDRGTPYCVYGLGMGDSEPTWGTELDSMVDYCMNQDAAMAAREGGE